MRTRLTAQLGICVLVSTAAWGTDVAPVAVTPGSAAEGVVTVEVCPFFEWTPVDAAVSYELVVYRVAEDGVEARPVLQEWIRGAYQSLSTPANRCLERGVSYAWAVRARGSDEVSDWSEPVFFQVGSVPRTVDDLEEPEAATELSTEPQGQPRKGTVPPKRPRVETRPDEPAGQESVLRLAFALTETTLEALAQSTGSRLASDLTSHFVRNGAGLDNLTAMLADTFDDKQLSELAVFFESSPGRAWSDGGPSLEVIEMLSIAGDPPDSGSDPDGGGWARRLAE